MTSKINYEQTASSLTGGKPMDFKAFPDGSLVVIAHDGKKHRFSAQQVQDAQPKPVPKPKTAAKRTRSTKTTSNTKKVS